MSRHDFFGTGYKKSEKRIRRKAVRWAKKGGRMKHSLTY